jgi:signal transduction histidine kinase
MAVATTRRMEALINRVVQVLQTQETAADYEVSPAELAEMLTVRLRPAAQAAGVSLETRVTAEARLANREADLILLILENLLQNAIEATAPEKRVTLEISSKAESLVFQVRDEGPGLPPNVAPRLFTPCASTKKGGSGIGLAISRQLAKHLGAELELQNSSSQGTVFFLAVPLRPSVSVPSFTETAVH